MNSKHLILPLALAFALGACDAEESNSGQSPSLTPSLSPSPSPTPSEPISTIPSSLPSIQPVPPSQSTLSLSLVDDLKIALPVLLDDQQMLQQMVEAGTKQIKRIEDSLLEDHVRYLEQDLELVASHLVEWGKISVDHDRDRINYRAGRIDHESLNALFDAEYYVSGQLEISQNGIVTLTDLAIARDGEKSKLELSASFDLNASFEAEKIRFHNVALTLKPHWFDFELNFTGSTFDIERHLFNGFTGTIEYNGADRLSLAVSSADVKLMGNALRIQDLLLTLNTKYETCTGSTFVSSTVIPNLKQGWWTDHQRCERSNTEMAWRFKTDLQLASGESIRYLADSSINGTSISQHLNFVNYVNDEHSNSYRNDYAYYYYHRAFGNVDINDRITGNTKNHRVEVQVIADAEFDFHSQSLYWYFSHFDKNPILPADTLDIEAAAVLTIDDMAFSIALDTSKEHIASLSRMYTTGEAAVKFFEQEKPIRGGVHIGDIYENHKKVGILVQKQNRTSDSFYASISGKDHLIYTIRHDHWLDF